MPFRIPVFNVAINLWHGQASVVPASPPLGPPSFTTICNLSGGTRLRNQIFSPLPFSVPVFPIMQLLFPKGTDVRGFSSSTGADVAEVPAGTGRYYYLDGVDDIGKAFSNEYRFCFAFLYLHPTPLP